MLQARGKLSNNKVNGPEDAVVSEMIQILPLEKIYTLARCFQDRSMGQMDAPGSWKIVKFLFLRKQDAEPKKGIRSYRAIAISSVVSKRYASCVKMRMEKEKELETWKRLHMGGVNNISCQHLQVLVINLSQKHWEWQEEVSPMSKHGSVIRPTMFMASLDIKSAIDEARPRHLARILESHNIHGWLISALLREMSGLEGGSMFECVESSFTFNPCLRQGSVEAPRL